jgi:hypothetical protein
MAHSWRIRRRTCPFANVHIPPVNCENRPSPFAIVRVGRICKQVVSGSSPLVSSQSDQGSVTAPNELERELLAVMTRWLKGRLA